MVGEKIAILGNKWGYARCLIIEEVAGRGFAELGKSMCAERKEGQTCRDMTSLIGAFTGYVGKVLLRRSVGE